MNQLNSTSALPNHFPVTMPPPPTFQNLPPQSEQEPYQVSNHRQDFNHGAPHDQGKPKLSFPPIPSFDNDPSHVANSKSDRAQQDNYQNPLVSQHNIDSTQSPVDQKDVRTLHLTSDEKSTSINTNEKELSADNHIKGMSSESHFNVKPTDKHSSERQSQNGISVNDTKSISKRDRKRSYSRKNRKDKKRKRSTSGKNRKTTHHKSRHKKHHRNSKNHSSHRGDRRDRHHKKKYQNQSQPFYRRHYSESSSSSDSSSSSESNSSSSSSSRERRKKRDKQKKPFKKSEQFIFPLTKSYRDQHPYFKRNGGGEENAKLHWDGFQWVTRSQPVYDMNRNVAAIATQMISGEDQKANEERIAASKTVIIENIALDLGLTSKEIQSYLHDQLKVLGETNVQIFDIDITYGPSSISVTLEEKSMVDKFKSLLDGHTCLGSKLKVRRVNEETAQTNAAAQAIALAAFNSLTKGEENAQLNFNAATLKTVNVSSVIKVSNIFDREEEMTAEIYEEIFEDMQEEFQKIPHLKRIKVIRNGEEKLGAEVGCVFVEFRDKKSAEIGKKNIQGRIYDGRPLKCCFVDEGVYYNDLYVE